MKVHELIEQLKTKPQDADVWIREDQNWQPAGKLVMRRMGNSENKSVIIQEDKI